jgi:hypothetical protein
MIYRAICYSTHERMQDASESIVEARRDKLSHFAR